MAIVNYLGRVFPSSATIALPLYERLRSENVWTWGTAQQKAFEKV